MTWSMTSCKDSGKNPKDLFLSRDLHGLPSASQKLEEKDESLEIPHYVRVLTWSPHFALEEKKPSK